MIAMVSLADILPESALPGGATVMVLAFVLFLVTGVGFPVVALGGWHGGFKTGISADSPRASDLVERSRCSLRLGPPR